MDKWHPDGGEFLCRNQTLRTCIRLLSFLLGNLGMAGFLLRRALSYFCGQFHSVRTEQELLDMLPAVHHRSLVLFKALLKCCKWFSAITTNFLYNGVRRGALGHVKFELVTVLLPGGRVGGDTLAILLCFFAAMTRSHLQRSLHAASAG